MLYIGTSGYSYADWRGVFYPQTMKQSEFLSYYSERFDCVELNFTYYRQPAAHSIETMAAKVPDSFRFTVKAHRTMTHEIPQEALVASEFEQFRQGILPMAQSGKLGCVLFQFPWSFRPSKRNYDYVLSLPDRLDYAKIVVEFRNNAWARDEVYEYLRERGIGFCCVDEPELRGLFPRVAVVTSGVSYVRFHGRNAAKWFNHKQAWERYDYLYSQDELAQWVPEALQMAEASEDTYVLFNNCHQGQAAINAAQMQQLLLQAET
ncbi:MAG TPA: DUF72 domain-containing protein [Firmicutes bacterium]|nr:DUF72 domain-containing protein [Bacillota bacterium]